MHCYVDVSGFAQSFTLNWLMDIFKSNDYPENFINDFFKLSIIFFQSFLDSKHRIQEKVITLPKNLCFQPFLVFDHYHCKLELSYENLSRVVSIAANYRQSTLFVLKIFSYFKKLTSSVVYKFQCGLCNGPYYGECVRHECKNCTAYQYLTID